MLVCLADGGYGTPPARQTEGNFMKTDGDIVTEVFLERIAYYRASSFSCARFTAIALAEILTRIEQDIANEHNGPIVSTQRKEKAD